MKVCPMHAPPPPPHKKNSLMTVLTDIILPTKVEVDGFFTLPYQKGKPSLLHALWREFTALLGEVSKTSCPSSSLIENGCITKCPGPYYCTVNFSGIILTPKVEKNIKDTERLLLWAKFYSSNLTREVIFTE